MWMWQSLDILDVVHGYDRNCVGPHPSIQRGRVKLHLASVRAMIPWCFAYDRLNYARYLPCYNAQMSQLHTTHPYVHAEFMQEGVFKSSLAPTTPSEESLSIKRSKKRITRTYRHLSIKNINAGTLNTSASVEARGNATMTVRSVRRPYGA